MIHARSSNNAARLCYAVIVAAITAWLLSAASDMPSQSADKIMPTIHRLTLGLLSAAVIGLVGSARRIKFRATDIFAAAMAATVAYNALSFGSDHPRYEEFAQAAMLYAAMRMIFSTEPKIKDITLVILFCFAIYEGVVGICQAFGLTYSNHGLFRITGTLFNPGPFAGLIVPVAISAAAFAVMRSGARSERSKFQTVAYIAAIAAAAVSITALPATMSRAAWVSAAIAAAALVLRETSVLKRLNGYRTKYRLLPIVVAISIIATSCVLAYHAKRRSADGRLLIWKVDTRIIGDNIISGVGIGAFGGAFGKEQAEYFSEKEGTEKERTVAGCPESGFNEYLQFGAETGIMGMLCLMMTVASACVSGVRRRDPYGYGLIAAAVFAMFSYPFSVLPLRLLFVILLAAAASDATDRTCGYDVGRYICYATICASATIWPTLNTRSRERAEAVETWEKTRVWIASERYDYVVEDGSRLYECLKHDFRFLYDYGYALHKSNRYSLSNEILLQGAELSSDPMFHNIMGKNHEALGEVSQAEECYTTAHNMIPSRIYPLYLKAMMYGRIGDRSKAAETAEAALRINLKIESEQTLELRKELREMIENYR